MKLSYRYFYVSHRKIKIRFYDFGSYWIGKWKAFEPKSLNDYENFVDVRAAFVEGFTVEAQRLDINPITGKSAKYDDYFLYLY